MPHIAFSFCFGLTLLCACADTDRSLPLSPQSELAGITRDTAGRPVGDMPFTVRLDLNRIATAEFWHQAPTPDHVVYQGRSDASGQFRVPVTRGREYSITSGNGESLDARPEPDAVDPRAAKASGRITDKKTRAPLAGAALRAPWQHEVLAHTGADGVYHLGEQPAAPLFVFRPGYQVGVVNGTWNVELERGHGVRGRLVDAEGNPIVRQLVLVDSDIWVSEEHTYDAIPWTTRTDEQGRFTIEELAEGARYWLRTILADGTPVELGEGTVAEGIRDLGTVSTGPATAVSGFVSWGVGTGSREGRVHVLRLYDDLPVLWRIARQTPSYPVDEDGEYRIPGLCPGRYELAFWLPGAEPEVRVVTAPAAGADLRLDVAVGPGRTFTGRVVDEDDQPIGGALLRALPWADQELVPLVPPGESGHNGRFLIGNVRVRSREDGSYELQRIRSHLPIRLTVEKEGFQQAVLRVENAVAPPEVIRLHKS